MSHGSVAGIHLIGCILPGNGDVEMGIPQPKFSPPRYMYFQIQIPATWALWLKQSFGCIIYKLKFLQNNCRDNSSFCYFFCFSFVHQRQFKVWLLDNEAASIS